MGFVAHFTFEQDSFGTVLDVTGHNVRANLYNGAVVKNHNLQLNGVNQYMNLERGILEGQSAFSMMCWVKPRTFRNYARIWDFGKDEDNFMLMSFYKSKPKPIFQFRLDGSYKTEVEPEFKFPLGVWTHVAVTHSGQYVEFYFNGKYLSSEEVEWKISDLGSTPNNWIGRSEFDHDEYLNASLGDFRIYRNRLQANDIFRIATGMNVCCIYCYIMNIF